MTKDRYENEKPTPELVRRRWAKKGTEDMPSISKTNTKHKTEGEEIFRIQLLRRNAQ